VNRENCCKRFETTTATGPFVHGRDESPGSPKKSRIVRWKDPAGPVLDGF